MSGFYYTDRAYPWAGLELRGPIGKDWMYRVRAGKQQCFPRPDYTITRTPAQQARRALFAKAVAGWHALSNALKREYNARASHRGALTGFDWYVGAYMRKGGD